MKTAVALEKSSEHPLAKAIVVYANDRHIIGDAVTEFNAVTGNGLTAKSALKAFTAAITDIFHSLLKFHQTKSKG